MAVEQGDYHWRNSMRPTRFFIFDSRTALAIFLVIIHVREWTIVLALVVVLAFWVAERRGYGLEAAMRRVRTILLGPRRPATCYSARRKLIDYGK
jgi:intracellular multiplication protein IcmT